MTGEKLDADGVKIDAKCPEMWCAPFHPITLTGEE